VPVHLVDHPLVHDALVSLRDKRTPPDAFRRLATRISVLLAAEALRALPTETITVETPIGPAEGRHVASDVVVVPVLRAGLGMLDAVLELVPSATSACSATSGPRLRRSTIRNCRIGWIAATCS
jgi:uracil phosphoribosyltransferase